MIKQFSFDVPVDVAFTVIPAMQKAGYFFQYATIDGDVWFSVYAHSDKEAFLIFTSALKESGCIRMS